MSKSIQDSRVDNSAVTVAHRRAHLQMEKHEFHRQLGKQPIGTEWRNTPFMKVRYLGFNKFAATCVGRPECDELGVKYDPTWYWSKSQQHWQSGFLMCEITQKDGLTTVAKDGKKATWKATIKWDIGEEIQPLKGPYIPEWSGGATLEWDYGWFKRQLVLTVGGVRELFLVESRPGSPPEAATLAIDTELIENTGIEFQSPYAVDGHRAPIKATLRRGYKVIPFASLEQAQLPVEIDDSVTYYAGTGDGFIWSDHTTWTTVRNMVNAEHLDTAGEELYTRAQKAGADYYLYRSGLVFDSSGLPSSASILAGTKVRIWVWSIAPSGSSIMVDGGSATCPHDTVVVGDYNRANYAQVDGGNRASCVDDAWNDITLTATGRGWVQVDAKTRLLVREKDHDFANSAPSTFYSADFRSANYDGGSRKPELYIVYSVPVAPTVTTQAADQIAATTARGNGNITDDGGESITQYGVCWKAGSDPVNIAGSDGYTEEGAGAEGAFTSGMTGLSSGTTYYYRAYATNSAGTSYGSAISFKTIFVKTITGAITAIGSLRPFAIGKVPEGLVDVTGTVQRLTSKIVAIAVATVTGTRDWHFVKIVAAAATIIGTIRPLSIQRVITGASDVTGEIVRFTTKAVATGAVTTSGAVSRATTWRKIVAAATATAIGTMLKKAKKVPVGAATVIGTIRPLTVGKIPDGQVTVTGMIQRFTSKIVATGQMTVGGLAIRKIFKTVATAAATVVGTVTRKTGKILTGAAAVTGLLRPFNVGKIVTGLTNATGTVIQFLYDINYVMNRTIRRIYAKVQIAYSDPFFSGGVVTSANQVGRESYTDQTADEVTTQYAKWFSLHRNLLDGTFHLMPSGKEHSVGWWGTVLSDAVTREFATDPVLTIEFTARTIEELLVVGDDRLEEYPEDFTVRLYSAGDVLEHTEDVNGNNLVTWTTPLSPVETDIVKMTLTIEKWSRAEAVSKIAQFFTSLQQIYYSEDGDLVSVRVLEEREYEAATIPQGDVSSSEITIRLNNIDDKFSPGNWESELYGMLKNNRAITAWLGVDMIPSGVRRWYPLGTFFSRDWFAPEDEPWAEVKGLDMLDRLRITEFSTSTVYTDVTLHDLAVTVMTDAGLTSADWEIDAALDGAAYTIPYAWFDRMSHREALRRIAAGALGQCYCNRDGKIVLEIYSAPTVDPWTDFHFTRGNFFTVDHPLAWTQMVNYVQARAAPRVASAEQDICLDTETFMVPGSSSVTKTHYFDLSPCIDVVDPVVFTNPGGHVTLGARNVYAWGMTQVYTNSDPSDETVTDVTIRGKLLEVQGGRIAVAQDADSIASNGKQALGEPISSEFWQSETMAQASADALLAVFKDPRRDVMMRARGNIGLALGDRVIAPDYKDAVTGHFGIMRQDIDFNGGMEVVITAQKLPDSMAVYYKTLAGKVDAIGTVPERITDFKEAEGGAVVSGSLRPFLVKKIISGVVAASGTIQAIPSIWRKTYLAVASVIGTVGRVWHFDLGAEAIDRGTTVGNDLTVLAIENPASMGGVITDVYIYVNTGGTGWKIGTYHGSDTDYTCRAYATLGVLSVGLNHISGLSINVVAGDLIGVFVPNGQGHMDTDTSSGSGIYSKVGDFTEAGQQTYSLSAGYSISAYATASGNN